MLFLGSPWYCTFRIEENIAHRWMPIFGVIYLCWVEVPNDFWWHPSINITSLVPLVLYCASHEDTPRHYTQPVLTNSYPHGRISFSPRTIIFFFFDLWLQWLQWLPAQSKYSACQLYNGDILRNMSEAGYGFPSRAWAYLPNNWQHLLNIANLSTIN